MTAKTLKAKGDRIPVPFPIFRPRGARVIVLDACRATCDNTHYMIKSFKHRGLKRLYERADRSRLPPDMAGKIETVLAALDVAATPDDMDRPSFRLHPLKGDRLGQWSVTVRANWRIVFGFERGNAHDVDFVDYH